MKTFRLHVVTASIATLALLGCGKEQSAPSAPPEKVAPYTYPAPVKGHYKEANVGEFDLVDGIAYPATGGSGTVIYVTDKPIASPMLAASACPMMQARALSELRNARYLEVTLNAAGQSKYFAAGAAFGGSSRESGARYWSSQLRADAGRVAGSVHHKIHGAFDFDLPLSSPKVNEVSESDRMDGRRSDQTAPKPVEPAVTAAYRAVHDAAIKKDLKALLTALGFDAKQVAAIRGLDGIDADLAVYSDRFLTSGAPGDFTAKPGTAYVRVEGVNAKGKKFANYYHFTPCGDRLVLTQIAENPQ
jgi:hypothetical protein